jgi:hypothetical protein
LEDEAASLSVQLTRHQFQRDPATGTFDRRPGRQHLSQAHSFKLAVELFLNKKPVKTAAGCCAAIPKINVTSRLKEIKTPTLVICGNDKQCQID